MLLRRAKIEDALDVLAWRNDPHTRAMSRDGAPVDQQAHLKWFTGAVDNPSRLLLIGEVGDDAVGMVRFDRADEAWEVSINLSPASRGRRLAAPLLAGALEVFADLNPGLPVLASIRPENAASLKLFKALGFCSVGVAADGLLLFTWDKMVR